ncbi:hypothetical protein ACL9RI_09670 [Janthinobacterium sp. Mn2066]|uniref:hypothetical protein n=1 Tax=Janthinobacterium sp. Mn2066 TaxID=3395264 RepID=UPI003BEA6186
MSSSKSRDSRPSGPDLLGKPSMAAEGQRILSQLEHGVAPPAMATPPGQRPGWRRPAGAVLGVALGVVLAALTLLAVLSTRSGEDTAPASLAMPAAVHPAPRFRQPRLPSRRRPRIRPPSSTWRRQHRPHLPPCRP